MLFRKQKNNELKRWHLIVLAIVIVFAMGVRIYDARWPSATKAAPVSVAISMTAAGLYFAA